MEPPLPGFDGERPEPRRIIEDTPDPSDVETDVNSAALQTAVNIFAGMTTRGIKRFLTKPQPWKRDLVRTPWIFPVAAMHLAAIVIQKAWLPCWLRVAKPSSTRTKKAGGVDSGSLEALRIAKINTGSNSLKVNRNRPPEQKEARCLYVREMLQERYLDLLKRQHAMASGASAATASAVLSYASYEHFLVATVQNFIRFRKKGTVRLLWKVLQYKRIGVFHVAAFEIQSAWRTAVQRWEMRLFAEEQLRISQGSMIAHARVYAATRIQEAWRKLSNYRVYHALRDIVAQFRGTGDPFLLLRSILPREAMLLDPSMQVHLRFRLGGSRFPPSIYYKIFTHGAVCDLGAFAPRNYAAERMGAPRREEDLYMRFENNGWRPLIARMQPGGDQNRKDEVERTTARKVVKSFHHIRLRRRQDVERTRKQRSIAWMRKLYTMAVEDEEGEHEKKDLEVESLPDSPSSSVAVGAPGARGGAARLGRSLEPKLTPRPPPGHKPATHGRPHRLETARTSKLGRQEGTAGSLAGRDNSSKPVTFVNLSSVVEDSLEDLPDDMLLEWSKKLDFDAYMDGWSAIATSDRSEGTLPICAQTQPLGIDEDEIEMYSHRAPPHTMIGRVY